MKWRKILGSLLLLLVFGGVYAYTAWELGWRLALAMWLGNIGIAMLVAIAVLWLIEDAEDSEE